MSALDRLLATAHAAEPDGADACHYAVTPDWMQGRTAYGGISAALALDRAMAAFPGDAPLRTANIGFVGPVGRHVSVTTTLLRQSKASRFVVANLTSEQGYGTHALFSFSPARASHVDHAITPRPGIALPEALEPVPSHPKRPAFGAHFDMRPARGPGFGHGLSEGDIVTWVRWVEQPACHPHIALLALADALPPAAMPLFTQFGPLSSSSWICHFLTDMPQTRDGWWLLQSKTEHVRNGFSSQVMHIWDADGTLVVTGQQGVALYV